MLELYLEQRKAQQIEAKRDRIFNSYLQKLEDAKAEVIIGDVFCGGGVLNHIEAIRKHSTLKVEAVPNLTIYPDSRNLRERHKAALQEYLPSQMRAIHTHVMPWILVWGENAQAKGIRWVHTYHLNYFPEHSGKAEMPQWQLDYNESLIHHAPRADIRLCVSRWHQQELLEDYGIESLYLPNGVDVAICDKAQAERFIQKSGHENFVLYVGRDDPVKNPRAFAQLAEKMPDQKFLMIGPGLDAKILQENYQQQTPENLVIHGKEDRAGVQDAIAACAALVVTSYREGLPTLVLEAMTQNKPIVVADEAGSREAIDQGRYGFIYQTDDIEDLVRQTRLALADTTRCAKARERVLDHYDWRKIAKALDIIYSEPDLNKATQAVEQWL